MKKKIKKKAVNPNKLVKKMEEFEKENPAIAKAIKTLDMSMVQYEKVLRSLKPTKVYTANSTKAL